MNILNCFCKMLAKVMDGAAVVNHLVVHLRMLVTVVQDDGGGDE